MRRATRYCGQAGCDYCDPEGDQLDNRLTALADFILLTCLFEVAAEKWTHVSSPVEAGCDRRFMSRYRFWRVCPVHHMLDHDVMEALHS